MGERENIDNKQAIKDQQKDKQRAMGGERGIRWLRGRKYELRWGVKTTEIMHPRRDQIMLNCTCPKEWVQNLLVVISGPSLRRGNELGFVPIPLSVVKSKRESSSP